MKHKNKFLTLLLVGSFYATSASAALSCEYIGNGNSFCEAITSNSQILNSYTWTTTGSVSISGSGAFASAHCSYGTCQVQVKVTYPDGSTDNWSRYIPGQFGGLGNF